MSELALSYYQERAQRLGIEQLPEALHGEPIILIGATPSIPVHDTELDKASVASQTFRATIDSVDQFVLQGTPDEVASPKAEVRSVAAKNARLAVEFAKLLVPKAVKTGKIDTVQLEALSRQEVNNSALRRIKDNSYMLGTYGRDTENSEVYFGLSGHLRSGSRRIIVGGIIVARSVQAHSSGETPRITDVLHSGISLKDNESAGMWMQRQSIDTSLAVTEHNMRHAFTNAVGTNRRQRGR